jgi:peptidyl-prolyl cis-trans isomerase SurA
MVCNRSEPNATLPSRDEIANQIGYERLDLEQRRYLRDLRASAYIDTRS